jgi:hypothetical protein
MIFKKISVDFLSSCHYFSNILLLLANLSSVADPVFDPWNRDPDLEAGMENNPDPGSLEPGSFYPWSRDPGWKKSDPG